MGIALSMQCILIFHIVPPICISQRIMAKSVHCNLAKVPNQEVLETKISRHGAGMHKAKQFHFPSESNKTILLCHCILLREQLLVGYLNLKNRKPPMTTNEKQAPSSTTKDLQHVYNKNDH
jgi:hypothetical protein